jgi:hypothetical protein
MISTLESIEITGTDRDPPLWHLTKLIDDGIALCGHVFQYLGGGPDWEGEYDLDTCVVCTEIARRLGGYE